MKISKKLMIMMACTVIIGTVIVTSKNSYSYVQNDETVVVNYTTDSSKQFMKYTNNVNKIVEEKINNTIRIEVFDGLTMEELTAKINRNLNSTVSGYGELFARTSINYGVDPYLVVSIMLHETGCFASCSPLARNNYNMGGIKAASGNFAKFGSMEQGVEALVSLLANGYIKKGLTTPEQIGPIYAGGSTEWAPMIRSYYNRIKNN